MKKNTKIILIVVAVLLVVLFGLLIFRKKANINNTQTISDQNQVVNDVATTTSSTVATTTLPVTKKITVPKKAETYTELVNKYVGYRFQFYNNCTQVVPYTFIIKKGEKFMIDNREDKKHVFTFANQKYTVNPYGYVIITTTVAGKLNVLCDGATRSTVTVSP